MEMAAQAGNNVYFDLFRFISIYFDLFWFILIYFDLFWFILEKEKKVPVRIRTHDLFA